VTLLQHALDTIGGLSHPSKMPCLSWSLPATACITGSRLRREAPDSPCAICYARKRHYTRPTTKAALANRLAILQQALRSRYHQVQFVHAFAYVLNHKLGIATGVVLDYNYFRWFDSGDLQSMEHAMMIADIAEYTPYVNHWLPTREEDFVYGMDKPDNLLIRVSHNTIDQPGYWRDAQDAGLTSSTVHTRPGLPPRGYIECKAKDRGHKCGLCRQCWNPYVHVSYLKH